MGRLTGMLTGKRSQALAAALVIGATALTLSATPAAAKDRVANGVRCAATLESGAIVFYLVGETIGTGIGGYTYQCMSNGNWRSMYYNAPDGSEFPERDVAPRGRGGR